MHQGNTGTRMRTVSFKLPEDLDDALAELARRRGSTKSELVREGLQAFAKGKRLSVTASAGDLVGSLDGPSDLSTGRRHMVGYGR
jgi:Arc/MetJ-type ribon-helix-helix transcriptional regulator